MAPVVNWTKFHHGCQMEIAPRPLIKHMQIVEDGYPKYRQQPPSDSDFTHNRQAFWQSRLTQQFCKKHTKLNSLKTSCDPLKDNFHGKNNCCAKTKYFQQSLSFVERHSSCNGGDTHKKYPKASWHHKKLRVFAEDILWSC